MDLFCLLICIAMTILNICFLYTIFHLIYNISISSVIVKFR